MQVCWQNPRICLRDLNARHPSLLLANLINCQTRLLAFLQEQLRIITNRFSGNKV
jgi:hypothetical protein